MFARLTAALTLAAIPALALAQAPAEEDKPITKAELSAKLDADYANLDADKVHVSVEDGTVTLTGEVRCWHERDEAETAAWSAPGVTRVQNNLSISI